MTQKNTEREYKSFFEEKTVFIFFKRITNKESKVEFKIKKLNLDHKKIS